MRGVKTPDPAGTEIVSLVKAFGVEMPEEQEKELAAITDADGAKAYLSANLSDSVNPTRILAQSVYAHWLFSRIPIQPILQVQNLYAIESCQQVITDCERQLNEPHKDSDPIKPREISDEYKVGLLRTKLMAAQCMGTLISKASKLALLVQPPKREASKPRNAAPDVLTAIGVHIHRDDTVTVTDERKVV